MINDRRQLADVYQQTIDIVLEGHYTSENGEEVKLPDNTKMLKGSRFYTKPLDASNVPTLAEGSTKIIVKNDDSIHCGHQLQQEGYNPVVLNLASRRNPGGGVKNGSRAQGGEPLPQHQPLSLYVSLCGICRGLRFGEKQVPISDACEIRRHLCARRYRVQSWSQG